MRLKDSNYSIVLINLFASLIVVFLFIALYALKCQDKPLEVKVVEFKTPATESIEIKYQDDKDSIYNDFLEKFNGYLETWNAEIDKDTLTIRFDNIHMLFSIGKSNINSDFKSILDIFFPIYINVLEKYKNNISEIRIEGYTDTMWGTFSENEAYIKNMKLSQERTFSVFEYCFNLETTTNNDWLKKVLSTTGLSSSKVLYNEETGAEEIKKSRRVEFKVVLKDKSKTVKVLVEEKPDVLSTKELKNEENRI